MPCTSSARTMLGWTVNKMLLQKMKIIPDIITKIKFLISLPIAYCKLIVISFVFKNSPIPHNVSLHFLPRAAGWQSMANLFQVDMHASSSFDFAASSSAFAVKYYVVSNYVPNGTKQYVNINLVLFFTLFPLM